METSLPELERIGLGKNEAQVYSALLELGETRTGAIVKKTGMHRVLIYDALDALIEKGLATVIIRENRKYFQVTDPDKILDFIKEKQEIAESLLPELNRIMERSKIKQQVAIYAGVKGLKKAFNDMLKELSPKGTYQCFASGKMRGTIGADYHDNFQKSKREEDIKSFLIYYSEYNELKDSLKCIFGKVRFQPTAYFPTDTYIYNDKVMIVIFDANPPFAVLIINKETAELYKKLFDTFWKNAKTKKIR